jgi:hypothetical protein
MSTFVRKLIARIVKKNQEFATFLVNVFDTMGCDSLQGYTIGDGSPRLEGV